MPYIYVYTICRIVFSDIIILVLGIGYNDYKVNKALFLTLLQHLLYLWASHSSVHIIRCFLFIYITSIHSVKFVCSDSIFWFLVWVAMIACLLIVWFSYIYPIYKIVHSGFRCGLWWLLIVNALFWMLLYYMSSH